MTTSTTYRIVISGGGTGGHVYPAIAIADAVRALYPRAEILFVGAKGKLEMEKVPQAGYPIRGLWISGFHRKLTPRNLLFPIKLLFSLFRSWSILRSFRPHVAVGVGGFASGPVLAVATRMGIPSLIQEQNSYPGITNKLLAPRVDKICVAYDRLERFFPAEKIVLTGNPVRSSMKVDAHQRPEAYRHFGLDPSRKTIFVFGGSLGAASINRAMAANADVLRDEKDIQVLWQAGKLYYEQYRDSEMARLPQVHILPFVDRMDLAFQIADLAVCRAGASTISELCLIGQPAILIPSPNVAEDHQTKNAQALAEKGAAVLLPDADAEEKILRRALEVLRQEGELEKLAINARKMAKPDAARQIADLVLGLIKK